MSPSLVYNTQAGGRDGVRQQRKAGFACRPTNVFRTQRRATQLAPKSSSQIDIAFSTTCRHSETADSANQARLQLHPSNGFIGGLLRPLVQPRAVQGGEVWTRGRRIVWKIGAES